MIKRQRRTAGFAALSILLCVAMLTGCATYSNFKSTFIETETDNTAVARIGVFEPLTGKDKEYGKLELQGIELAHELFPEVLGKKVELVYADNKSDVDVAATTARQLVDQKVSVVLGSYGNTLSLVGADLFAEAKIPAIAITATNPLVTSSNDYYFRTCFVESFQGVALAKYTVEQLGITSAAILKDADDDYAAAVSQTFSDKLVQLTANEYAVAKVVEYHAEKKDFKKQLKEIKDSGATVALLASRTDDALEIMRQAKEAGIQLTFLGTDSWGNEDFLQNGGPAVEGAIFSAYYDAEVGITANTEVFLKAYREKYGQDKEPPSEVALGFDAYLLAINAIGTAGTSVNGEAIRNQLALTRNYPGASGNISFDENGDPIKSVVIKTITNGAFVHLYTVEPTWQ
ncbi:MAG: hypothetical protein K0Q48_1761 [Bacillota bacterium]|nr:hypothetical protein [Bacillota bacterium]